MHMATLSYLLRMYILIVRLLSTFSRRETHGTINDKDESHLGLHGKDTYINGTSMGISYKRYSLD